MSTRRAEAAARALLARHPAGTPAPDPRRVAAALGVTVVETEMEPSLSGMLVRDGQQVSIGVNRRHSATRKRFTIAHELGHLRLHRGRALILDSAVRLNFRDAQSAAATNLEEIEANAFAAELLMPAEQVERAVAAEATADPDRLTTRLATRFRVSPQAMGFRLVNLGHIGTD